MSMPARTEHPRSPDEPMAFSRDEFFLGSTWTLCAFIALIIVAEVLAAVISDIIQHATQPMPMASSSLGFLPIAVGYTIVIAGIAGAGCMLAGAPLAYVLARSLRRVRSIAVHVSAFACFGAVFGALCAVLIYAGMTVGGGGAVDIVAITPITALGAAFTAGACTIGWSMAARRARRDDRAAAAAHAAFASGTVSAGRAAEDR